MSSLVLHHNAGLFFKIPQSDLHQLSSWCVSIAPSKMLQQQEYRCGILNNLVKEALQRGDSLGACRIGSEYLRLKDRFNKTAPINILSLSSDVYQLGYRDLDHEFLTQYFIDQSNQDTAIFFAPCQPDQYQITFVAYGTQTNNRPVFWKVISQVSLVGNQFFESDLALSECYRIE